MNCIIILLHRSEVLHDILIDIYFYDRNCIRKIGEGSFGEVFMGQDTVYKVVPVGGDQEINDVEQTTFENAFQEIAVSRKLSDLAGDQVLKPDQL